MNSLKQLIFKLTVFWVCLTLSCILNAQDSVKTNLKENAARYFSVNDFQNALPLYHQLLEIYPKEPVYQYRTALCLLNLNRNLDEAAGLFRSLLNDNDFPMAAFYYGRTLHLQYSFEDAIKAYSRFLATAKKSEIKRLNVQRYIEMAKNGIELTRSAKTVTVKNLTEVPVDQLAKSFSLSTNGKIISKPKEFNSKYDQKVGFSSLMNLPFYTEINEYVYVSGYHETGKKGKEIFRIKNVNHQAWGMPELLNEIINTNYNEDYPFFDIHSSTLYFSSEGHSSMGGYDIFKSVYDWNTKTWSKPQNLGFPINSPYDDFMLVTDELGLTAQFASNRNTSPGKVILYKILMKEDETELKFLTTEDKRELSLLSASASSPVQPMPQLENNKTDINQEHQQVTYNKSEYNLLIAEALILQLKADSLSRLARDQRIVARNVTDNDARKQMISDIIRYEKEAKKIQQQADEKYLAARKIKNVSDTILLTNLDTSDNNSLPGISEEKYLSDTIQNQEKEAFTKQEGIEKTDVGNTLASPSGDSKAVLSLPAEQRGLVYRIQLGVYSMPRESNAFNGLFPLFVEWIEQKNVYKYYTGSFSTAETVASALEKVRQLGFPDAFVVAFYNGEKISTEKAREIEFAKLKL